MHTHASDLHQEVYHKCELLTSNIHGNGAVGCRTYPIECSAAISSSGTSIVCKYKLLPDKQHVTVTAIIEHSGPGDVWRSRFANCNTLQCNIRATFNNILTVTDTGEFWWICVGREVIN